MTPKDFIQLLCSATAATIFTMIFKWITDRQALKTSNALKLQDGSSSVQVAAISTFQNMIEAYQEDIEGLRTEIHSVRESYEEKQKMLNERLVDLVDQNQKLLRLCDRTINFIYWQHSELKKFLPDIPEPSFPKNPNEIL